MEIGLGTLIIIKTCLDCPHHRLVNDADPEDSFRDDDEAILCRATRNPNQDPKGYRSSDRSEYRPVRGAIEGTEHIKAAAKVPDWCPLLSRIRAGEAPPSQKFIFPTAQVGRLDPSAIGQLQ